MTNISKVEPPHVQLRHYRELRCLTLSELGNMVGKNEHEIKNYEKQFNPIQYKDAVMLADALKIDYNLLMDEYTRFCKEGYGNTIKQIRALYNMSQNEFAKIIGVTRSTLSIWESEIYSHHPNRNAYLILKELAKKKGVVFDES